MPGVTYTIDFAAAIARLEQGTKKGARAVREMADEIESATSFAKSAVLALAGALGVHAFGEWIKGASEAADASAKLGDRFGIATEHMVGMQHAAALAGASSETLTAALRTMQFQATQAAMGLTESQRAFNLLNINVAEFLKLPADQQLRVMVDRLEQTANVTIRNAAAQQLLGRGAGDMMGLVAEGAGAIDDATRKTEAWGLAISRIDAAKLEIANDAMQDARAAASGVATTIAVALAPVIKLVADRFSDAATESRGFRDDVEVGMQRAVSAVGAAIWFTERLGFAWDGLKYLAALAINGIIQALAGLDRAYTDTMNSLANSWIGQRLGMQAREYSGTLQEMATVSTNRLGEIKEELDKFALSALSLEEWQAKIKSVFAQAKASIQAEAEDIARRRQEFGRGGDVPDLTVGKKPEKDKYQEDLEKRVEQIRVGNLTEMELLEEHLQVKQDTLDAARAFDLITEEEYQQQLYQVNFRYSAQRTLLQQKEQQTARQMQFQTYALAGDLLQQFAGKSKAAAIAAIAIQKGLAIAGVIVNTEAAIARGYMELGPWGGAAFESAMRTQEAIQIGLIAATGLVQAAQVGSGGAASGTAANPQIVQPVAPSGAGGAAAQVPTSTTIIQAPKGRALKEMFSGEDLFEFLKSIEAATRDGGRVIIA